MSETMSLSVISDATERLLLDVVESSISVRLEPLGQTRKSHVYRAHLVASGGRSIPATVVVKRFLGRDSSDSTEYIEATERMRNEWTACLLLNTIEGTPSLAPHLFGGDFSDSLLVMEDLGAPTGPNTAEQLMGNDPDNAAEALCEASTLLGRLHGTTLNCADQYDTLRHSLVRQSSATPAPVLPLFEEPWSAARRARSSGHERDQPASAYRAQFERIGITPHPGVDDEIAGVAALVEEEPGPYLALCKGDQNLAGDFLRCGPQPRLFDFDTAGLRHALLEGMPGRMTWGCMLRIPGSIVSDMDDAYRREMTRWLPQAENEADWYSAMANAGARWHIFHVLARVSAALTSDWQRGPSTARQQTFAGLEAFANTSEEFGRWPALGTSARRLSERLRSVWPYVEDLPYYPAFSGSPPRE